MNTIRLAGALVLVAAAGGPAEASMPQQTHPHHAASQKHGEKGMGFDQKGTTHHFRLSPAGGTIEVHVNNPDDRELREQVTTHLKTIAEQFARGDFSAPFAVHSEKPDGVPALAQFSRDIVYTFVPDETGGKVSISTGSKKALAAVHAFLRYQIREHQTGDSLKVGAR